MPLLFDKEKYFNQPKLIEQEARQQGLYIFKPKLPSLKTIADIFISEGLNDKEILCYVMCAIVGWSYRHLAKFVKMSAPTIKKYTEQATQKRKKI